MTWALVVLLGGLLLAGCAHQERFVRQRIALSPWCSLTLIQDRRSGACFVAYHCGPRAPASLVVAPQEVCQP